MPKAFTDYAPSEQTHIKCVDGMFKILSNEPEGMRIKDLITKLATEIKLSEWEKELLPKTQNIRWVSTFLFFSLNLVKANYIVRKKGIWRVTELGKEVYKKGPIEVFESSREIYSKWYRSHGRITEVVDQKSATIQQFVNQHAESYRESRLSEEGKSWRELYKWTAIKNTRPVFEDAFTPMNVIPKVEKLSSSRGNLVYHLGNFTDLSALASKKPLEVANLLNDLIDGQVELKERVEKFNQGILDLNKNAKINMDLIAYILFCSDPHHYVPYKGSFANFVIEKFKLESLLTRKTPIAKYEVFLEICKFVGEYISENNFLPEDEQEFKMLNGQDFLWVNIRYGFYSTLLDFLEQSGTNDLKTSEYPKQYDNFAVDVSFGMGAPAKVSWITFLSGENKTSNGIYVCYLYYKNQKKLVLALGVSETNMPKTMWESSVTRELKKVKEILPLAERYRESYVYKMYDLDEVVTAGKSDILNADLQSALSFTPPPLPQNGKFWLIDVGDRWNDYFTNGFVSVGYDQYELGDLNQYESKSAIRDAIAKSEKMSSFTSGYKMNDAHGLWEFAYVLKPGDIIIAKSGTRELLGYGTVQSNYRYDENREEYKHLRSVTWDVSKSVTLEDENLVIKTLTNITQYEGYPQRLLELFVKEWPIYTASDALEDLFIEREDFKEIQSSLEYKKNLILQGPPGVGKTFFAKRLAYTLIGFKKPENVETVQFHQSYSYEDFIQGFRPTVDGKFVLKNGVFFDFCKKAKQNPNEKYVFIIDEINRGNLSKIFGELMMLIEPDKRGPDCSVRLTYASSSDDAFYVPENVYIIGTMNTADRSLAMVDYALRRRFRFVDLKPEFNNAFKDYLSKHNVSNEVIDVIIRSMGELNAKIADDTVSLGKDFLIGHSYFTPTTTIKDSREWFESIVNSEIAPQLREYYFDDETKAQALIDLIE